VEVEFRKALRNGRSQPRAVKKAADKRSRGVRAGASDYRRQDGHATGPRLRPWPTQGHETETEDGESNWAFAICQQKASFGANGMPLF
jgi:hypothetical protein